MAPPLAGIKVLDLGLIGVGPWAANLLGALGADVIKIEPPAGDPILGQPPLQNGLSTSYSVFNYYKRSAQIDLTNASGLEAFTRLVEETDVVMENMRPRTLAGLGFDFERLRAINPRIVYATCPAWGEEGPLAGLPGVDTHLQVFSGFASITGDSASGPQVIRYFTLDLLAGSYFSATVLLGLIAREKTGEAQRVSMSHLASSLSIQSTRLSEFSLRKVQPELLGSASSVAAPDQAFLCEEGRYLAVSVMTEAHWLGLCEVLQAPHLGQDQRYADMRLRVLHRAELNEALGQIFKTKPSRWWATQLEKARVPHGLFFDSATVMDHAQAWENGYITVVDIPHQGQMYYALPPWKFTGTPLNAGAPPNPGEHTEGVMRFGFGTNEGAAIPARSSSPGFAGNEGTNSAPLDGLKVLELAEGLSGPFLGYLLAHAGAEVTKVEPPGGEAARHWAVESPGGDSVAFCAVNANKESVTVDPGDPSGEETIERLAAGCDLVIDSLPWSRPEGIKPGYEKLRTVNPSLVWCSIDGFGSRGPLSGQPPSELVIQATSGLWSSMGSIGSPPIRTGADVASLGTGVVSFIGALAALLHRIWTGEGQHVEQSMFGSMVVLRGLLWSAMSRPDEWHGPYCNTEVHPPYFGYSTKDKHIYFTLHRATEEEYLMILTELGMEDVFGDPRFHGGGRDAVGNNGRYTREVWHRWEEAFRDWEAEDVVNLMNKFGGCAVIANDYANMLNHPQVAAIRASQDLPTQNVGLDIYPPPWKGGWKAPGFKPAPAPGEHTAALVR